jgi:hypothetical protein
MGMYHIWLKFIQKPPQTNHCSWAPVAALVQIVNGNPRFLYFFLKGMALTGIHTDHMKIHPAAIHVGSKLCYNAFCAACAKHRKDQSYIHDGILLV